MIRRLSSNQVSTFRIRAALGHPRPGSWGVTRIFRRLILATLLAFTAAPAFGQVPAPVPALPDAERRTSYAITASTCACGIGFQLYGDSTDFASWVEVFINGVRYDYNDASHGWTITSPSGPLANLARPITNAVLTFNAPQTGVVQIVGARRPRRASQFNENAGVSARNLNQVFTDIISENRELWDKTNRSLLAPFGERLSAMPAAATRAGKFLYFDSTGLIPQFTTGGAGSGNVVGPASSTVGSLATWDNTTGTLLSGTTVATIGPGIVALGGHVTNFNVYPVNADNGIQLSYGTGAGNGEGGGITFYTKNPTGSGAPAINQELGFTQVSAWNGSAYHQTAPPATVYITTEAWDLTNNGAGVLFQAITRGETAARGEVCIAEGLKAMAAGATSCQVGLGIGTINAANGLFDNGNRPFSASNFGITVTQNAPTTFAVANASAGTSAFPNWAASNVNGSTTFGTAGSGYTGFSSLLTNKGVMLTQSTLDGLVLYADGAAHPIDLITNGTLRARALLGFMVGTSTDPGAGVINVLTGFRIGNAATSGNVLRGNGTNFVSSALAATDLSGLGTGVGTALGVNVGSAGAFVTFNGALGSPSSAGTMPALTLGGTITGGSQNITGLGTIASTAHTITSASANALAVGANGTTNPTLQVDASVGSPATGIKITAGGAGGGAAIAALSSAGAEDLYLDAKSTGVIRLGNTSTGNINFARAIAYGGVTLNNAVSGTGNMALTAGTTFTGTTTVATLAATTINAFTLAGTVAGGGNQLNNVIIGTTTPLAGTFTNNLATTSLGFTTGSGGTVTQGTSRATGVTINKPSGSITLFTAAPVVGTWVFFTVTNSTVAAIDTVHVSMGAGASNGYEVIVSATNAGSFQVGINSVSGTTSDTPIINFAVIKGSNS